METKRELVDLICELFGVKECPPLILKQIHSFVTEHGYSFKDIARALCYFVDYQNGTLEPKYGIGIVPYVMKDAQEFFHKLAVQKEQQIKSAKKLKNESQKPVIYIQAKDNTIRRSKIDIDKL